MNVRRAIIYGIIVILSIVTQTSVLHFFSLANIVPNVVLIVVISFAIIRGRMDGLVLGFICGLLLDVFTGNIIGLYALIYMFIGYVYGYFHRIFYSSHFIVPLFLIFTGDFLLNLGIYFFLFLMRGRFDFVFYLTKIILPESVYTFLVSILLYNIFLLINNSLVKHEKGAY